MRSRRLLGATLVALAGSAPALCAQRLTVLEASAGGAVVLARQTMAGAELGVGYRPAGQSRVAFAVAGGIEDGRTALRAQLTAQFLVTPAARRGAGLYGGIGVAATGRRGSPGGGYLAVLVELEAAPGRRAAGGAGGWYAELGLAGGARIAAGWRGRWFPGWSRG